MGTVPTVLDQSMRGERAFDTYSLSPKERIVFRGHEVDDRIASLLVAEILYLDTQDPEREIQLYINSPGGLAHAELAIHEVMQHVSCEVATLCIGMGMSAAPTGLCGGARGKRRALLSARIMIHRGSACTRGAPRDMETQVKEVMVNTRRMEEIIAHHSNRSLGEVEGDIDRDYFMTAEEARSYGPADEVPEPRRGIAVRPPAAGLTARLAR